MKSVFFIFLAIFIGLSSHTSSYAQALQDLCSAPVREAVLKKAGQDKIGNPVFLDGVLTETEPNIYSVLLGGDTEEGFFNINYTVKVKKDADTCLLISIEEASRSPHE